MSKEVFRALDLDVERLIVAGGGSAGADEGLIKRKEAFEKLAAQVPALKPVVEQMTKVLGGKARAAATELLNLSSQNLRLRAAQVQPFKPEGAGGEMPRTAPLETPLGSYEIDPLYHALTKTAGAGGREISGRNKIIEDAVERGAVLDLRLLELWVQALRDSGIADMIETQVMPKLGEAAMPLLLRDFKKDGKGVDARRLACIVAIRGKQARGLLDECLAQGSPDVRAQAVRSIGELDKAEGEKVGVEVYGKDKSKDVRDACVDVIAEGETEAGLEVLIKALGDADEVRRSAIAGLKKFKHKKTTDRVFGLLTAEALDIKPYVPPKVKKGTKLTKAQQQAAEKEQQAAMKKINEKVEHVNGVLDVLAARSTPQIVTRMIELFQTHKMVEIRQKAGEAMLESRDKKALEALVEKMGDDDYEIGQYALRAFFRLDPKTVYDRAQAYFKADVLGDKKRRGIPVAILEELNGNGYVLEDEDLPPEELKRREEAKQKRKEERLARRAGGADVSDDDDDDDDSEELTYWLRAEPRWGDLALKHVEDKHIADECITLLGNLRDQRAFIPLSEMFPKTPGSVDEIGTALVRIGKAKALPLFIKGLGLKATASASISALGELKEAGGVQPLIDLLPKAGDNAQSVVQALGEIGDRRAAVPIAKLLTDKKFSSYPWQLIQTLKKLDDPACVPQVEEAIKKVKKGKNQYVLNQYEELLTHLQRDRTLSLPDRPSPPGPLPAAFASERGSALGASIRKVTGLPSLRRRPRGGAGGEAVLFPSTKRHGDQHPWRARKTRRRPRATATATAAGRAGRSASLPR